LTLPAAVEFRGVSKAYNLRHEIQPYLTFREALTGIFRRHRAESEEFYALRDVTFDVFPGDTVGIIGKNGAGKSTLLKILSRITPPTEGTITIRGRIASLLEVGTGFHYELTGRENIFLNGSILGMQHREIRAQFDAIVDFSGTERFLDTPLKHFSSGMQLRLAFAVAAFLEPEILVIDEVLAVGDAEFQKKCLGKMEDVSRSGRTILFVSHNLGAVKSLCRKCVLLERGSVKLFSEDVPHVVSSYLSADKAATGAWWQDESPRHVSPYFAPRSLGIVDAGGRPVLTPLDGRADYWVSLEGEVQELHPALNLGYALYSEDGTLLYWTYHTDAGDGRRTPLHKGRNRLRSQLPQGVLNEGTYRLELIGGLHYIQWLFEPNTDVPNVYVEIRGLRSESPFWLARRPGLLAPHLEWTNE
jgi:lipopolysaccharide transport system ATP-binding protein